MRCPGIEPGALTWKASILPLNQQRKKRKTDLQFLTTPPPGFEPGTSRLEVGCAVRLRHEGKTIIYRDAKY